MVGKVASIWLTLIVATMGTAAAKSTEHVVLFAWPGGRSHGFVAATIAERLAKDHGKVSLVMGEMDHDAVAPLAGPEVNVVTFPVTQPKTMKMLGMGDHPEALNFGNITEEVIRISELDDPIKSLEPIAMASAENADSCIRNKAVTETLEAATFLVADLAWAVYEPIMARYPHLQAVSYSPIGIAPGILPRWPGTAFDPAFGSKLNGLDLGIGPAMFNVFNQIMLEYVVVPKLYEPYCDLMIRDGTITPEGVANKGCVRSLDAWTRIGLVMVLSDPAIELPMPMLPTFEYVGHVLSSPAKPLPAGDLADFVNGASDGFILVSFGTLGNLPQKAVDVLARGLGNLAPLRVVWKVGKQATPSVTVAGNIKLVDWMPQNNLLGHPKIKVFVTHGGRNSIEEASYHGVPLLGKLPSIPPACDKRPGSQLYIKQICPRRAPLRRPA